MNLLRTIWRKWLSRTSLINKARVEKEKLINEVIKKVRIAIGDAKFGDVYISIEELKKYVDELYKDGYGDVCVNEIYALSLNKEYEG